MALPSSPNEPEIENPPAPQSWLGRWMMPLFLGLIGLAVLEQGMSGVGRSPLDPAWDGYDPPPLVMDGGDPYIRALMRTISYSEANDPQPYSLLYGGDRFSDFRQHPDRCLTIRTGPNRGDCTTAAGRYQFITTTWELQARRYHPDPDGFWVWRSYDFSPEAQDRVVYGWLSDPAAWGVDLATLLRQGRLDETLEILSPTWTSLGYGIETNALSNALPMIYEQVLIEELQQTPVE